jgi:hypothetical protein
MSRYNSGITTGKTSKTNAGGGRKPPRRAYRLVAFKVFDDTDSDISEWLAGLDDGSKSDLIRAALKAFITGQKLYPPASESSPLDEIRQQLEQLQQLILSRPLVAEVGAPGLMTIEAVESDNILKADQIERRAGNLNKTMARW